MFDELRRSSKTFMWFMVVAFVGLIFLAWGADFQLGGGGGGQARTGEVGRVNGEPISAQQYQQVVNNALASFQQPGQQVNESTAALIRSQAWTNLIQQTLLRQEADRLGLGATDREVLDAVLNQPLSEFRQHPSFQTNGQFDLAKYQATLRSPGFDTRGLESQYRYTIPLQKLQQRVMGSVVVSDQEIWDDFRLRNEKVKIQYLLVNAGNFEIDAAGIPEDRLQSHYQEHQKDYEVPPQAIVEYVLFPKRYTQDDSLATYDLLQSMREDVAAGDDFLAQIADLSESPATQRGGANASWSAPSALNPVIRDAIADLEVGVLSEVVIEPRGFHVLRIEEKREEETAGPQVKIADLFVSLKPSTGTLTELQNRARSFREEVGGGDLKLAAESTQLQVRETSPLQESGLIPGLGLAPEVQSFAFSNQVGAVSAPLERGDSWIVVRVKERRDHKIPAFAEVQARVRNEVADADQRAQAKLVAERLLTRVQAGETFEAIAKSDESLQHKTIDGLSRTGTRELGNDPDVIGPIFAQQPGVLSQPLVGRAGAYLIDLQEKIPAERSAFDAQKVQLRESARQQRQNQLFADWVDDLLEKADIADFREGAF